MSCRRVRPARARERACVSTLCQSRGVRPDAVFRSASCCRSAARICACMSAHIAVCPAADVAESRRRCAREGSGQGEGGEQAGPARGGYNSVARDAGAAGQPTNRACVRFNHRVASAPRRMRPVQRRTLHHDAACHCTARACGRRTPARGMVWPMRNATSARQCKHRCAPPVSTIRNGNIRPSKGADRMQGAPKPDCAHPALKTDAVDEDGCSRWFGHLGASAPKGREHAPQESRARHRRI